MSVLYEPEAVTHDECEVGCSLPSLLRVLPLASVSLSLSIFITPSFLPFLLFSPLPSFQGTAHALLLHAHPCEAARANAVTHTPLCLYLIIGSITGDIFPDNATEGGEPGRAQPVRWGGGLFLITLNLQNWRSHRMRRMNLIYFPSEAPATCSNTPSFTGGPHIFPEQILERRVSGGVLAETNLLAGLMCISPHPPSPPHHRHSARAYHTGLFVCSRSRF